MSDQRHYIAVALPGRSEHANIALVRIGADELTDNQAAAGCPANRVLAPDEDAERFVRGGFAQPRFEVIEQLGDLPDLTRLHKFRLTEQIAQTAHIQLVADGSEPEVVCQFHQRVNGVTDGPLRQTAARNPGA